MNTNIKINFLTSLFLMLSITGCGVKSPERQAPPETFTPLSEEVSQSEELTEPKVNILFVVDNSGSMKPFQKKMADNIDHFSNTFFDNTRLEYRIGIVPVYDSKFLNDKTVYYPSGPRKMNPLGELVPLKGLETQLHGELDEHRPVFITKETPNPKKVLRETVMIGVQWGPEAEESYSPVLALTTDETLNNTVNQGFYQKDAYLAIIFLTDADDVTPGLSGEEFYQRLIAIKGGDRSKILVAAALLNPNHRSLRCPSTTEKGAVQSFPALLAVSSGTFADLCSHNFGSSLAEFGNQLVQRVASQKKQLHYTPDITTLTVSYGLDSQPESLQILKRPHDYTFNPQTNEIILNPYLKLTKIEGAKLKVSAKPVSLGNYKSKRFKTL